MTVSPKATSKVVDAVRFELMLDVSVLVENVVGKLLLLEGMVMILLEGMVMISMLVVIGVSDGVSLLNVELISVSGLVSVTSVSGVVCSISVSGLVSVTTV